MRESAPATFGVLHIAPLAPAFLADHAAVTIEFGFSDHYVDLLEERWDVAIRISRLADSSLMARKLVTMRIVVCASHGYLATRGAPASGACFDGSSC